VSTSEVSQYTLTGIIGLVTGYYRFDPFILALNFGLFNKVWPVPVLCQLSKNNFHDAVEDHLEAFPPRTYFIAVLEKKDGKGNDPVCDAEALHQMIPKPHNNQVADRVYYFFTKDGVTFTHTYTWDREGGTQEDYAAIRAVVLANSVTKSEEVQAAREYLAYKMTPPLMGKKLQSVLQLILSDDPGNQRAQEALSALHTDAIP
jgi:hypothetical protein